MMAQRALLVNLYISIFITNVRHCSRSTGVNIRHIIYAIFTPIAVYPALSLDSQAANLGWSSFIDPFSTWVFLLETAMIAVFRAARV